MYDPARPTNVAEYLQSDERIREIRDWKAVLYAHRRRPTRSSGGESDNEDEGAERPSMGSEWDPAAPLG